MENSITTTVRSGKHNGSVAELAYAAHLKCVSFRNMGSNPIGAIKRLVHTLSMVERDISIVSDGSNLTQRRKCFPHSLKAGTMAR